MFRTVKVNTLVGKTYVTSAGDQKLFTAGEKCRFEGELIIVNYCISRTLLVLSVLSL